MERKVSSLTIKSSFGETLWLYTLVALFLSIFFFPQVSAAHWSPLIERLAADGFDEQTVRALFSRPEVKFEPGAMAGKLEEILKRPPQKPDAVANFKKVYGRFLDSKMITRARSYIQENQDLLERINRLYCVPKEIIVAILLVETRLGEDLGKNYAFNSLASMAFCTDLGVIRPYLPKKLINSKNEVYARTICRQKADWAYAELKALLLYADKSGLDPLSFPGSIYGAIGLGQFMPSSILFYGVDADQDGRIDLFAKTDAFYSLANYLRQHGWLCSMDIVDQHQVIFRYNKSVVYANTVLAVAEKLREQSHPKQ